MPTSNYSLPLGQADDLQRLRATVDRLGDEVSQVLEWWARGTCTLADFAGLVHRDEPAIARSLRFGVVQLFHTEALDSQAATLSVVHPEPLGQRVESALLDYLRTAGESFPDSATILQSYPDLAVELCELFAHLHRLRVLGDVLWEPLEAGPSLGEPDTVSEMLPADRLRHRRGSPLAASLLAPSVAPSIPGFVLLDVLGVGGMGIVYLAYQPALKRKVALKLMLKGLEANSRDRQRFQTEAEAIARVKHTHIVEIFQVGEHEGRLFLVLEFVPGETLAKRLENKQQDPAWAAGLIRDLALGIHHAHTRGIVHRDLKPTNVLLHESGLPRISDFGLARDLFEKGQTRTGSVLGTPAYMAPEQASGRTKDAGPPADIYALGAILYESLTGQPPFHGEDNTEILHQVRTRPPVPVCELRPDVPPGLARIVHKCLEKNPADRYVSAKELAERLESYLAGEEILDPPPSWLRKALRLLTRRDVVATLGGGVALSLLGAWILPQRLAEKPVPPVPEPVLPPVRDPFAPLDLENIPRHLRQIVGVSSKAVRDDADRDAVAISEFGYTLWEWAPETPWDSFEFSAEVRHDSRGLGSQVGLYFGWATTQPNDAEKYGYYLSFAYADRGTKAIEFPNGMTQSQAQVQGHVRSLEGMGLRDAYSIVATKNLMPQLPVGQRSPWRKLILRVGNGRVQAVWEPMPEMVQEVYAQPMEDLDDRLNLMAISLPEHRHLKLKFPRRGGIGLFVNHARGVFRNITLKVHPWNE